ncbi:MAG: PP2C family protein-serine/threonine phosphatase [Desulfuromonadales bacterium]|nr:PP2C family protein-serine/threonine phosphatase [Desulfuromonadales bacterium]
MAYNDGSARSALNLPVTFGESRVRGKFLSEGMELAEKVQQLLLPKSSPTCNWCRSGVKNRMAAGLGGDYFDIINMPDECQSLFIGDVTGHGLHASVVMSLIYGFIHPAALGTCAPLELVQQVNRFLIEFSRRSETIDQYFSSSLFYGVIDPRTFAMHYVNAGQVPALVLRAGKVEELHSTGPPIGFFEMPEIQLQSYSFARGDRFLLYTDGVTETANACGEPYGLERLKELLRTTANADHLDFLGLLFQSLSDFGVSDPPEDDCSAIVIDLHGSRSC